MDRSNLTQRLAWEWLAAAGVLFAADLAFHLPITNAAEVLVKRFGFPAFDRAIALTFLFLGLGVWVALVVPRRRARHVLTSATALLVLAGLAHWLLVVNSIENIHYPQYALLAFLIGRSGVTTETTWLGTTLFGAIDEGYQYVFLRAGRPEYFDWNDVLLNAIGAAFGIVWLASVAAPAGTPRYPVRLVAACIVIALLLALAASPPVAPFFTMTPAGRRYHVLSAFESVAVMSVLWAGLRVLERRTQRHDDERE